ncbi:hypothetical protein BGX33_010284 [Mortierella sp. NVP41]|nr:hypothetical protein BGX33_010284 [Mortierella sp. NVP41]
MTLLPFVLLPTFTFGKSKPKVPCVPSTLVWTASTTKAEHLWRDSFTLTIRNTYSGVIPTRVENPKKIRRTLHSSDGKFRSIIVDLARTRRWF